MKVARKAFLALFIFAFIITVFTSVSFAENSASTHTDIYIGEYDDGEHEGTAHIVFGTVSNANEEYGIVLTDTNTGKSYSFKGEVICSTGKFGVAVFDLPEDVTYMAKVYSGDPKTGVLGDEMVFRAGDGESVYNPADMFNVSESNITSLTMLGQTLNDIIIPSQINGEKIVGLKGFVSPSKYESMYISAGIVIEKPIFTYYEDSLNEIVVDKNSEYYKTIDGNLYTKDGKTLVKYATGKADTCFEVPAEVENFDDVAIYCCKNLQEITFAENSKIAEFGEYSIYNCDGIKTFSVPKTVVDIGENFLGDFDALAHVFVEDGSDTFVAIEDALYTKDTKTLYLHCIASEKVEFVIPETVERIESFAFSFCGNLERIYIPENTIYIGPQAFYECSAEIVWNEYAKIEEIGSAVFLMYRGENITIPKSVSIIREYAFRGRTIESITYLGTIEEWNTKVLKENYWVEAVTATYVQCSDGRVEI